MPEQMDTTTYLVRRLHDLGVSYADIGGQLGVHWRTVYRWGRGETHPATAKSVNQQLRAMLWHEAETCRHVAST